MRNSANSTLWLTTVVSLIALCAAVIPAGTAAGARAGSLPSGVTPIPLYGSGVKVSDPAHPEDSLFPTGVNTSGVVSALEYATVNGSTTVTPVVWSYTGSPSNPDIHVTPLHAPSGAVARNMFVVGISNSGSLYGWGDLCTVPLPGQCPTYYYHPLRWDEAGAVTNLGYGWVRAMSPGDAIAGESAKDAGTSTGGHEENYECGAYSFTNGFGHDQVTPNIGSTTACAGIDQNQGPFWDDGGSYDIPTVSVGNDGTTLLWSTGRGPTTYYTDGGPGGLGPTLAGYCPPVATLGPSLQFQPSLISNAGLIVGSSYESTGCSGVETGGVWDATTGAMTTLVSVPSSATAYPHMITPGGEIFGLDGQYPALWPTHTST
ncbi:MAG TPA: hypothetical protein VG815_05135, partial [Chloroflexota bacterium]|nr:hypothetical protein [Chloroflexota bacterium]